MKRIKLVGAGFLLILIAMFLQGFDSPVTGIALVAGVILLITGCFSWASKLHWVVALVIGVMMLATTYLAGIYIPVIVKDRFVGDERNEFLVHLIGSILFWPGIVLISMTPIIAEKNRRKRNEVKSGAIAVSAPTNQKRWRRGDQETGERNDENGQ